MGSQRNLVHAWIGTAVLGLAVAASASAASTAGGKLSSIAIENFGQGNVHYYRGSQPVGHDYADLSALGVKTVIDLTGDGEADPGEAGMVQQAGMKFVRIPMTTHAEPTDATVSQFLQLVNDPANQPVYVHCQGGHHRTGVMTAVYRMTQDGWAAARAYAEMQQYGFGPAILHSALKNFVYAYHPVMVAAAAAIPAVKQ